LVGGTGNDFYGVDDTGDVVVEAYGAGTELVQSSITYILGDYLENLTLTGSGVIDGTGNSLHNILTGNSAANTLDGGTGADTLIGGAGDDVYVVDNTGDVVIELTGGGTDLVQSSITFSLSGNVESLTLTGSDAIDGKGNALENILIGNSAQNTLDGGLGSDSLTGGSGQDQFVFSTSLNSTTNVDTLLDFQTGADSIVLSEAVFAQLADLDIGSSPSADNLLIGDAALDANDYLLYNSSTGVLYYDADGSGTASAAVAFAKIELNGVPPSDLSAGDFVIST
jgi:Ca2+-binding RTX toxin-like protein